MREQVRVATTRSEVEGVIPDKMYFRIGEVAAIVGVKPYVLRYWESEFAALRPQKSRTRQRMYRRRDVELLLKIKHLLYDRKYTIAGARQLLKRGFPASGEIPPEGGVELLATPEPLREERPESLATESLEANSAWASPITPLAVDAAVSSLVAPPPTAEIALERSPVLDSRSQLVLDLRVSDLVREDLSRGLRELVALCDSDEAADPDPLSRSLRHADDVATAQESASDPG